MNLLGRRSIFRNVQNPGIIAAFGGSFLLRFSTTNVLECDPSSSLESPVDFQPSEMVDYLINSCGLPSEAAAGVCRKLGRRGRVENAKRVINFLRESGFMDSHIRKAITRYPHMLGAKLEKTVMPKVKAFFDWGLSGSDVGRIVATSPVIFNVNFEKKVVPVVSKLRSLLTEDEKAVKSIKRFFLSSILGHGVGDSITTNLATLRRHGVPDRTLSTIVERWPSLLGLNPRVFEKMAKKAKELGPYNGSSMYSHALYAVCSMSEPVWDAKLEVLKEFGWTQEDIVMAFQKAPLFLTISAGSLKRKLKFFVDELSYDPLEVASNPHFLMFSLEKRVVPRLAVIKMLDSKDLCKRKKSFITILHMKDVEFHEEYVLKHKDECPDIIKVHSSGTSGESEKLAGCYSLFTSKWRPL
ncbi:unnamed protein product [Victoria cruziana]